MEMFIDNESGEGRGEIRRIRLFTNDDDGSYDSSCSLFVPYGSFVRLIKGFDRSRRKVGEHAWYRMKRSCLVVDFSRRVGNQRSWVINGRGENRDTVRPYKSSEGNSLVSMEEWAAW
jgi:hypothetical protein